MVTEYRDEILKVTKGGLVTTQMEFEKGDTRVVSKPAATTTIASSRSPKYSTDDERSVGSSDVSEDAPMKNEPLKNTNTVKEEGRKGAILDMLEDESENKSLAPEETPEPVESPRAPLSAIVDERNTLRNPFDIGHDEFLIGLGAVAALSVALITSIEEEGADESGESDNNDKEVSAKKKKVRKARDEETRRKQAGEEKALKAKAAAEAESKRIAQAERLEKEKKAMVIKKAKEQEKVKEAAAEAERKRISEAKRLEKERMEIALKKAEEETAQKANVEAEQEELAMKNATEQAKTLEAKRIAEAKRLEQEKKVIAKKKKAEQAKARKLKAAAEAEAKRIDDAKRLEQEKEKIAANQAEEEKARKAKAVAKAEAEAEAEAKRISEAERLKQEKEKIAAKQAEEEKARKAKAAAEAEAKAKRIVEAERLDQEKKVIAKKKKAEQAKALEAKRIADAERLEQEKGKARKAKATREAEAKRIAEAERLEQGKKEDMVSKKAADEEKARMAQAAVENNNNETPVDLDSKTEAISQATPFDKTRADFQVLELDRHSTYETTHEIRASASSTATNKETPEDLSFTYDFDELVVGNDSTSAPTTAVMLIHPIGVGIGRWYYDRLMLALDEKYGGGDRRYVFISPDLLGSGSACSPIIESGEEIKKLPLLTIRDWSEQLEELMADYEAKSTSEGHVVENWCVVANGGCSPIALKVAEHAAELTVPFEGKVTNVVLSSPPRLPFFLEGTDPAEVQKSYRTLCGPAGKLFWWNALRKVHEFSERNLVGNPESLGEAWTPNCVATGKLDGGRSRYSTFAFLAGTLQEGCQASLDVLRGKDVKIDFIRGKDKRKNKARSGLSEEGMKLQDEVTLSKGNGDSVDTVGQLVAATEALSPTGEEEETIQDYVKRNGNSGKTKWVGGRISLAHEDGEGYATALMEHIS